MEKEPIDNPEEKIQECEKQKEEYLNGWKRAKADLLNYKKEEAERMHSLAKFIAEEFILEILPVLDSFERAEKEMPEEKKDDQYCKGLLQIKTLFEDFLKSRGVEEIKALGEKFNPEFHEAELAVESEKEEPDKVVEVTKKGYSINGRVIRAAKVKVSK